MYYSPEKVQEEHEYRASLTKPYVEEPDEYPEYEFTKLVVALSKKHTSAILLSKGQAKDVISCLSAWLEEAGEEEESRQDTIKTYTLFWLGGDTQIVNGPDPASAMNNAGIGAGALPALDFYAEGDSRDSYVWSKEERTWKDKS